MSRSDTDQMEAIPTSGRQYLIASGDYEACIASVGGTLRRLTYRGEDLISPFEADELQPGMRGGLLAPWPNRTEDGCYSFEGVHYQLAINEPKTNNASHGLVNWLDFGLRDLSENSVTVRAQIEPQRGYPWRVRVETQFTVFQDRFVQRITATNLSPAAAPFGMATHPYLLAGPQSENAANDWTLELPARTMIRTNERLLPAGDVDVAEWNGGEFDFRTPRKIGTTEIDYAFTDLARDGNGIAHVRLTGLDGHGVEMVLNESAPWVQVFTSHANPGSTYRCAVALEPMTCPPNALNSGRDLVVLAPHESTSLEWTLRRF